MVLTKNPAMKEMQVRSLGQEDPPGEGNIHSSILAWRTLWTEEPGALEISLEFSLRENF